MKFQKKPIVVDAEQWFPGNGAKGVCNDGGNMICGCVVIGGPEEPHVHTAHDMQAVIVQPGDWIIPEPMEGRYYPVKPDIFAATYEPAPQANTQEVERE